VGNVVVSQVLHRLYWITMKTIEELAWSFGFSQTLALALIICEWHLLDLFQKNCFALSQTQNLALAEVTQFPRGLAPTNPPLMATKFPNKLSIFRLSGGRTGIA